MINPFYWFELKIRASEKKLWIIAMFLILSVLLTMCGTILASVLSPYSYEIEPIGIGKGILAIALIWHAVIIIVMAPLAAAGRISQEKEQRTLPGIINTTISSKSIVWGKLFSAWTFIAWITSFILPFLVIGVLWGGLPTWQVILFLIINLLFAMVISSVALGFSSVFRRSLTAYLITGVFMLVWLGFLPLIGSIIGSIIAAMNDLSKFPEVVSYICFYNNPFYFYISLLSGMEQKVTTIIIQAVYCFACWGVIAWLGIVMARKGLKKDVY